MNKTDKKTISEMWVNLKACGMNRYRFAWYLMVNRPHLVIKIVLFYLREMEKK